jgi:hypothetical protein
MSEFKCEYCDKSLKTLSSLNNHIKTAKYCLEIQGRNKKIINTTYNCHYCDKKLSSKRNLDNHIKKCKDKYPFVIELETKIKELEIQLEKQKQTYLEQIEIYKHQNFTLQQIIEKLSIKAIEKPTNNTTNNTINTTNTTNNTLNIMNSIDFNNLDKIKNIIDDNFTINYAIDGQKGIAKFVADKFLKDENGNLTYVCTDPSRYIFKYKDNDGEIKKDLEAKKLTNYIVEGGIRKKTFDISNQWYKTDNGDIDMEKFNIILENQESILNLNNNNNTFKKELASITLS